jgi:UDP-N-acetylmuramoylalanine--D-glutamate ligase
VRNGAQVLVTDKSPAERLVSSRKELEGLPVEFRLGEHRIEDFTSADLIVASPAIPPHNEFLVAARQAGVPITTEIRLFIERCSAKRIVGVTGTKGKSTTTTLLGRMLGPKFTTHVGGNFGRPLLLEVDNIKPDDVVVLELSSFMLEYLREMQWSPHVAVVTMLGVDHIDWHGSAEACLDAKKLILKYQKPGDIAVLSESSRELASLTQARSVVYSASGRPFELTIPGKHNQFNCQAAWTAAREMGVSFDAAQQAVRDFPGLPHRLQLVHESKNGVRWFNDSIATIPEAAIAALDSFPPRSVLQIVGGSDKGLPFTALAAALCERAKAVLCIGTTGPTIAALIADSPTHACAPVYQCGDVATAVTMAIKLATRGDVVLLSTGCASYDQFANFEQRGETFADLARQA